MHRNEHSNILAASVNMYFFNEELKLFCKAKYKDFDTLMDKFFNAKY